MVRGRIAFVVASSVVALAAAGGMASATPQDVTAEFSTTRSDITASELARQLDRAADTAVSSVVMRFDASAYDSPEAAAQSLALAIAAEVQVRVANAISQSGATASVAAEALRRVDIGDIVQSSLTFYAENGTISAELAEAAASDVNQPLANAMGAISTVIQNAAAGNVVTASTGPRRGRIPGLSGRDARRSGPPTITVIVYRG